MKKTDLIGGIKELKKIKPDENWLISSKKAILAEIYRSEPKSAKAPNAKAPVFVFSFGYKLAGAICVLMLMFSGVLNLAQSASVDSPFYELKIAINKTIIALAPQDQKLDLKIALTQTIVNDLNKKMDNFQSALAVEILNKNLEEIAVQLRQVSHPVQVAILSEKIQQETAEIKSGLQQIPTDKPEIASAVENLQNQIQQVENEVFALKQNAEEKINNCPANFDEALTQIEEKIDRINLTNEKKEEILNQLKQADELLGANRCVDALVIIDKLEKDLEL